MSTSRTTGFIINHSQRYSTIPGTHKELQMGPCDSNIGNSHFISVHFTRFSNTGHHIINQTHSLHRFQLRPSKNSLARKVTENDLPTRRGYKLKHQPIYCDFLQCKNTAPCYLVISIHALSCLNAIVNSSSLTCSATFPPLRPPFSSQSITLQISSSLAAVSNALGVDTPFIKIFASGMLTADIHILDASSSKSPKVTFNFPAARRFRTVSEARTSFAVKGSSLRVVWTGWVMKSLRTDTIKSTVTRPAFSFVGC